MPHFSSVSATSSSAFKDYHIQNSEVTNLFLKVALSEILAHFAKN